MAIVPFWRHIAKISDIKIYSKNMNQMFNTTYENGSWFVAWTFTIRF